MRMHDGRDRSHLDSDADALLPARIDVQHRLAHNRTHRPGHAAQEDHRPRARRWRENVSPARAACRHIPGSRAAVSHPDLSPPATRDTVGLPMRRLDFLSVEETHSALPLMLAGPILRRMEPNLVAVWVALSRAATAKVYGRSAKTARASAPSRDHRAVAKRLGTTRVNWAGYQLRRCPFPLPRDRRGVSGGRGRAGPLCRGGSADTRRPRPPAPTHLSSRSKPRGLPRAVFTTASRASADSLRP